MKTNNRIVNKEHKTRYLPGIDGVRGIAVIAIIIYHLNPQWLSGGFLGVDTFFAISGFLITSLLLHEYHYSGTIAFRSFWTRRIKRLIPAFAFLLIVVLTYTLLFEITMIQSIKQDVIAALFYISNWWYIFQDVSYFESLEMMPLKHLWSLAVEEQFYIFWPIVLFLFLIKVNRMKFIFYTTLGLSIMSLCVMLAVSTPFEDNSRAYFGTDSRLNTLLLGALLAYVWPPFKLKTQMDQEATKILNITGYVSLTFLIILFVFVDSTHNWIYFGGLYVIALITLPLIAVSSTTSTHFSIKVLGNPILLWIGKRSYSLYLWHFPVIVFSSGYYVQGQIPSHVVFIQVLLIMAFAEFSYRYIEMPFRKNGLKHVKFNRSTSRFIKARNLGVIIMTGISLIILTGAFDGFQKNKAEIAEEFNANAEGKSELSMDDKNLLSDINTDYTEAMDIQMALKEDDILFIGDSITVDLGEYLQNVFPSATIDGKVGRQLTEAIDLVKNRYSNYTAGKHIVVVQLGSNGSFQYEDLIDLIEILQESEVYLVNTRVPRAWESDVNKKIENVAKAYENVYLVNWHKISKENIEYFAPDGIHLNPAGVTALSEEIIEMIKTHSYNVK